VGLPLLGSPFARAPDGRLPPWALVGVPVYLALLAAPGYVACLAVDPARLRRTLLGRTWIRASLALLFACALLGAWAGTLALPFLLPSLATAACCAVAAWRFETKG
jgi:O-antigen ligase